MNSNTLERLENWYRSKCDGDWEHYYGVKIDTLDEPGWSVDINLEGTNLDGHTFREVSYGVGADAENSGDEWIWCRVEEGLFKGVGGPSKLEDILRVFLDWAEVRISSRQ
jgi:hypothetical protein